MPFRSEITSLPDARNKMGKVVRVSNGLIDIATVGGNGVMRGIRCAGVTPQAGDKVLVTFYKNGEILATAISSSIQESAPITTLTINTGDSGGGSGTVSSVALSMPSIFAVGGSPITASGTLAVSFSNQTGHHALLGPNSGTPGAPTFRAIQAADLPADVVYLGSLLTDPSGIFDPTTGGGLGNASFVLSYLSQAANKFLGSPSGAAGQPGFRTLAAADMAASVNGTSGTIAKFTGTNVIGNSILTESGAALSAAGALTLVGQSNANQFILKAHSTQTTPQILVQTSAAAELARLYFNATYSIVIGYQAGATLGASTGSVLIGYQAGNALTTNDIVAIGYQAGKSATGGRNVFIGKNAGRLTVGGDYNVAIGEGALETNVSGQSSFALGYGALGQATASENTAVGVSSLQKCTTGYYNVAIGTLALGELLGATGNIGVGQSALRNLVSGTDNTAIGTSSGYNSTGSNNIFLGHSSGASCTGSNNVIVGWHAGRYTGAVSAFGECVYIGTLAGGGTGNYCVGVGRETLTSNVTAATAVGYQAGKVATGAGNVFLGYQSGVAVSSGANNTILGYQAGASLSTNGGSVMIGYQAGNAETAANKLYIANSSTTTPLIYGDFSTPSLTFNGTVNIAEGKNIVFGTTTGSKLGATTSDKMSAWGATPIVQPTTAVAAATFTANSGTAVNDASTFDGYTIKQIVKALRNIGWLA